MKNNTRLGRALGLLLALALLLTLSACAGGGAKTQNALPEAEDSTDGFLIAVEDEPDTVDFQCTSIHYTIAQNVFNRLVAMENDKDGNAVILPELAESWEISPTGALTASICARACAFPTARRSPPRTCSIPSQGF